MISPYRKLADMPKEKVPMTEYEMQISNMKTITIGAVFVLTIAILSFAATNMYSNYVNTNSNAMNVSLYRSQEARAVADQEMFKRMNVDKK